MPIAYKLTDQKMRTYKDFRWELHKPVVTSGNGDLCSNGWLHFYEHPLLAVLHNPIHAAIDNPRLFVATVFGECLKDRQLKLGYSQAVLTKELPLPVITLTQRIAYAILCAKTVYKDEIFQKWANNWLCGKDRTCAAADAAAQAAADAAYAAADAAAHAAHAAQAAADAAYTAADAVDVAYTAAYVAAHAVDAAASVELDLLKLAKRALKYE